MNKTKSRLGLHLVFSFALCWLAAAETAMAAPGDPCAFPQGLESKIASKFPGGHVVRLVDLDDYDKKLYKKDHGSRCPGLLKVNFYGDEKPTWALVLISGENPKRKAELVVARQFDSDWDVRSLEITDGTPGVWSEKPGKYEGLYKENEKTIHAAHSVIVFCGYESWAIVYAWNGREVEKVWVSD